MLVLCFEFSEGENLYFKQCKVYWNLSTPRINSQCFHRYTFIPIISFRVRFFYLQLILRQPIQTDLETQFVVKSQLRPSIQSVSSPCVGLQVVAQFTFLLKDCYPQLVLNQRCSEILPPKKVDFSSILCSYLARFSASAFETFSLKNFLHFFLKKFLTTTQRTFQPQPSKRFP